jgi:hypothetical protein
MSTQGDRQSVLRQPAGAGASVSYTGTAGVSSAAIPTPSNCVMVWCSTDAYIKVGPGSTLAATAADTPLPALTPIFLPITDESGPNYISAIRISSSGTMYFQAFL